MNGTNGTNGVQPRDLEALLVASIADVNAKRTGASPEKITPAAPLSSLLSAQPNHNTAAPHVYRAICQVAKEISRDGIAKGNRNQQQGYSFRGIDDVYNALSALLAGADLCILPRMMERTQEERTAKGGSPLFYVTVRGEFDFVSAQDGSKHTVTMYGEAMDSADKATNKAMSAAYKYAAMQTFCIPTEGMTDADATTPTPGPKAPVKAPAPPPPPPPPPPPAPPAAKPWKSFAGMLDEFAKLQALLPAEAFFEILMQHGVRMADDFRKGPRKLMSENAAIALACYQKLLHAAADHQEALAADPTTYEHFEANEGGYL